MNDLPRGAPIHDHDPLPWAFDVLTDRQGALNERLRWQILVRQSALPTSAKAVALMLVTYMGKGPSEAWPSEAELGAAVSLSARQIRRLLIDLEKGGWVLVNRRRRPPRIRLCWPLLRPEGMREVVTRDRIEDAQADTGDRMSNDKWSPTTSQADTGDRASGHGRPTEVIRKSTKKSSRASRVCCGEVFEGLGAYQDHQESGRCKDVA